MNILKHKLCSWNNIDWKAIDGQVFKWQRQIYTASKENDIRKVRILQNRLFSSYGAKLLAIRRITQDNKRKKTAGIDGVKELSPKERLSLTAQLKFPKKASPIRRVWIPKPGKLEKRPLGIATIYDRCLQALIKLGLEPEWEARFEPNSYGFRPGRNAHDAMISIKNCMQKRSKYVLDADIAKCFDTIDHEALLEKIGFKGRIKRQIKFWLEAGVLDQGNFQETTEGMPQGGVISPLLANIALHGLEEYLKHCFKDIPVFYESGNKVRPSRAHETLHVIRYADDFVVLHDNLEVILRCRNKTQEFLNQMGLTLSDTKTRLTHTLELKESDTKELGFDGKVGFNFLGFTVKQFHTSHRSAKNQGKKVGYKTLIYPSKESINAHQADLHHVVLNLGKKLDQKSLVNKLNPIIRGWANYFGVSHANTTNHLGKQDYLLYLKLRKWAQRIKGKSAKASDFWYRSKEKKWCFGKGGEFTLGLHTNYALSIGTKNGYIKVISEYSYYDENREYWDKRFMGFQRLKANVRILLLEQNRKCKICGGSFKEEDVMEVDHIIPKKLVGINGYTNLQLLQRHCHHTKTLRDRRSFKFKIS
jgi:RNA-directed DNA polymerase